MIPKVVIVGRPNVGKSSLLNMIAGRRVSIVDPTAGVTRDRVSIEVKTKEGRYYELVDTGGYGVYSGDGELGILTDQIEGQIGLAMEEAQVVLFVVDGQSGVAGLDEQVARLLRERVVGKKRVVLVANKVDGETHEAGALDATRLGFGGPVMVSATTGQGKWDLLERIEDELIFDKGDGSVGELQEGLKLAIVGKRNAGKSTLVNALVGAARVITSELAGTTRDSVDVRFEMGGKRYTAIDTAGLRKRKSVADDVEYYSMHRALRSIRRADVVVLLLDATEQVSQVDKKLSQEIQAHYKPCVIGLNKWDLVEKKLKTDDYLAYIEKSLKGLNYAPMVFLSAKKGEEVAGLVETAEELYEQSGTRVGTGQLNTCVKEILAQRGPSSRLGSRAKIHYVTMPAVHPPTIVMFVNHAEMFTDQYQRYMLNAFRERLPFAEVPIKLVIRERQREERGRGHGDGEEMEEVGE